MPVPARFEKALPRNAGPCTRYPCDRKPGVVEPLAHQGHGDGGLGVAREPLRFGAQDLPRRLALAPAEERRERAGLEPQGEQDLLGRRHVEAVERDEDQLVEPLVDEAAADVLEDAAERLGPERDRPVPAARFADVVRRVPERHQRRVEHAALAGRPLDDAERDDPVEPERRERVPVPLAAADGDQYRIQPPRHPGRTSPAPSSARLQTTPEAPMQPPASPTFTKRLQHTRRWHLPKKFPIRPRTIPGWRQRTTVAAGIAVINGLRSTARAEFRPARDNKE